MVFEKRQFSIDREISFVMYYNIIRNLFRFSFLFFFYYFIFLFFANIICFGAILLYIAFNRIKLDAYAFFLFDGWSGR